MKYLLKPLICLFVLTDFSFLSAQSANWCFGYNAGLSFTATPPTAILNSTLNTAEGSSTYSDLNGNLLFYTDGITVYNQNHSVMSNGSGLHGNQSTTQAALILKQPGNTSVYYVFTLDATGGANGLKYSVVDMSLAAGMGSVTIKNTALYTPSCEKMAAVKHCNGTDTWLVTHDYNSDNFRAYLLDATGISASPVLSATGGTINVPFNTAGQMKISPSGNKLGLALYDGNLSTGSGFQLFDFDPATGIVSNPLFLYSCPGAYGCEFSPDGSKFYGSRYTGNQIFQWDLCAGSNTAIIASLYAFTPPSSSVLGSMQLAINGKIYLAVNSKQSLSVINSPNNSGATCNYAHLSESIAPNISSLGLPNFESSSFRPKGPAYTYSANCQTATFTPGSQPSSTNATCGAGTNSIVGVKWIFGDPSSGASNTTTLNAPTHTFSATGNYTVNCIYYYPCGHDTVKQVVNIVNPSPVLAVAGSYTACKGQTVVYSASGASTYSWSTSSGTNTTGNNLTVTPVGTTTVTLIGTNTIGCTSGLVFTLNTPSCLSLNEGDHPEAINLFPNPFSQVLNFWTESPVRIIILNINGSIIVDQDFPPGQHSLVTQAFNPGIYTLKTLTRSASKTFKLVKL